MVVEVLLYMDARYVVTSKELADTGSIGGLVARDIIVLRISGRPGTLKVNVLKVPDV